MLVNQHIEDFYDARFGLFIHWGLYSLLAGEWHGQRMDDIGEWIMSYHKIPIAEYEKLAGLFNPISFDAEAIVTMAKQAGMRYLVITSKHHEGFALFHSKVDPYNVVDATPFGRDIIAELAAACKKHGMKFGLYYSQALDWHERNAGGWDDPAYLPARRPWGNIWDFPDPAGKNFEEYFSRKVLPQVTELLTNYGDIFLLWFDTPRTISTEQSARLYNLVKSLQPGCLVNSRIGNGLGDYDSLGDNQLPTIPLTVPSESPVTLNDTWGYKYYDENWKNSRDIIGKRVRLAAKNANFLLNIGPRGDGSIPEETVRILAEVGGWTAQNREALDGTRGNPYHQDFPWGSVTAKGSRLFCFVDDNRKTALTINGLKTPVRQVTALADQKPVAFTQTALGDATTLRIELIPTDAYLPAYRIDFDETPVFSPAIIAQDGGVLALYPHMAETVRDGKREPLPRYRFGDRYRKITSTVINSAGALVGWNNPDLSLQWEALVTEPGIYQAEIQTPVQYNQKPRLTGQQLVLTIQNLDGTDPVSCRWQDLYENGATAGGLINMATPGPKRVTLQATAIAENTMISIQCVRLILAPPANEPQDSK